MLGSIKYNLANLGNFNGRDARQTFWFYILFLVIVNIAVSMAISIPMMVDMFSSAFEAARAGAPQEQMELQMMAGMGGWLETSIWIGAGLSLVMVVLFVAAFVRRLHDSNKPSWLAAIPVATQLFTVYYSISSIETQRELVQAALDPARADEIMQMQTQMGAYGLVGWIGYIVVIIFGVMRSTDGPNQYGDEPVRF